MLSYKQNNSYVTITINMLIFKLQGIVWDLSMMRINYMLTKRTVTIKKEKLSKKGNIRNFMTIHYKLTASSKIIH